jgi:hypothetical protein
MQENWWEHSRGESWVLSPNPGPKRKKDSLEQLLGISCWHPGGKEVHGATVQFRTDSAPSGPP